MIFDHNNFPKTRRSILIVCVLIFAGERYLSSTMSGIDFGGLKFDVTKDQIIDGFCIGLLYLWFVAIAQFAVGQGKARVVKWEEREQERISKDFAPTDNNSYHPQRSSKVEYFKDNPEAKFSKLVKNIAKRRFRAFDTYSTLIFTAPSILLTELVWLKYDGFFRGFAALSDIFFN